MNTQTSSSGVGICGVLFIVFIVLKLVGVISWSWWWVTAPLWVPYVIFIVGTGLVLVAAGLSALFLRK